MTAPTFSPALRCGRAAGGLGLALKALWWAAKGDRDRAHGCVQRGEGDLANAGCWCRRAGRPPAAVTASSSDEWEAIAASSTCCLAAPLLLCPWSPGACQGLHPASRSCSPLDGWRRDRSTRFTPASRRCKPWCITDPNPRKECTMDDDLPKACDPDVERIASDLLGYITTTCASGHTLKITICEALYEMQALARGERYRPAVTVNGVPPHGAP